MNIVVTLAFIVCFIFGFICGYLFGIRRGKIVVNLRTKEMNEMTDRVSELESCFQDIDAFLDENKEKERLRYER